MCGPFSGIAECKKCKWNCSCLVPKSSLLPLNPQPLTLPLPHSSPPAGSSSGQQWGIISEFQYRPRGPVIHFLNTRLLDAVVEAFLFQAPQGRWKKSEEPRNDVVFHPISRRDVHSLKACESLSWGQSQGELREEVNGGSLLAHTNPPCTIT